MRNFTLWCICLLCSINLAYTQKTVEAVRISESITIDGILDEAMWETATPISGFTTLEPQPGFKPNQDTEISILYDDEAVYFGAFMQEASKDSIMTQMTERDDIGNTDAIGFFLDAYQNGNDAFLFIAGATGVQFDALRTRNNEDDSWDAVWEVATTITDHGWFAEFKIPYSALRFPKKDVQEWNINFIQLRARLGETNTWVPVDVNIDNPILVQMGKLTGIRDVKTPIRLSFTPYGTVYYQNSNDPSGEVPNSSGSSYNFGMDVKYGINDAFTLDMTLVPDFGQTQADDQVLNLSPFEVRFDENRAFFTEGLDLFNKGDIFYSRRVGGTPIGFYAVEDHLKENEEITSNPSRQSLYNATKISGRNNNGLGIGFFNAVAAPTFATIENLETGAERKIQSAPLTNYNVVVFDQNLKNNSSVSLINTNVTRNGDSYHNANVTATEFNLKNKKQTWGIQGGAAINQIINPTEDNDIGYKYDLAIEKLSGNLVYGVGYNVESENYNPNDLGFLRAPNEKNLYVYTNYRRNDGFGPFQQFNTWVNLNYSRLHTPNVYTGFGFNTGFYGQNKAQWDFNMWANYRPKSFDYFEPRVEGRFYEMPGVQNTGFYIGTDERKKLQIDFSGFVYNVNEKRRHGFQGNIEPRYRINDRLSISFDASVFHQYNDTGYVNDDEAGDITFGRRDVKNIANVISSNFAITKNLFMDLRVRHNWIKLTWNDYILLLEDGTVQETSFEAQSDFTFNFFSLDYRVRWRLAPGSDLIFVWQNQIFEGGDASGEVIQKNYFNGVSDLSNYAQNNNLSLRLVYYLDYNEIRKGFK